MPLSATASVEPWVGLVPQSELEACLAADGPQGPPSIVQGELRPCGGEEGEKEKAVRGESKQGGGFREA